MKEVKPPFFVTRTNSPHTFQAPFSDELSPIEKRVGFYVNWDLYKQFRDEADIVLAHEQDSFDSEEEFANMKRAWAIHAAKTHPGFHGEPIPREKQHEKIQRRHYRATIAAVAILIFILLLLLARVSKAEPRYTLSGRTENGIYNLVMPEGLFPQTVTPKGAFQFDGSNNLKVNCITGCSASAGFTDNSAFTVGSTTVNPIAGYFTSGADPAITSGNAGRARIDSHSYLFVDCVIGCAGGNTTPSDAFANPTTAGLQFDLLAGFNGTTWDRLRVDASKNLFVALNAPIPAGTNVIGHVITDSGSTTVVTGTVTVAGNLTNNNAAPAATEVGVLPARANAANPTWTEGDQVLESVDLSGNQRVLLNSWFGSTAPTVGSKTSANSIPVVIASDQGAIPVNATLQTGANTVGKVDILGNAGGIMDAAGQNASSPANELLVAGQFNTAPTTITSGNVSPIQLDSKGQVKSAIYDAAGNNRGANVTAGNAVQMDLSSEAGTAITNTPTAIGTKGTGNVASFNVDDTSVAGTATVNDGTAGVKAIGGHLADNGAAAATNRVPTLDCIYRTDYHGGAAGTAGNNGAPDCGTDGLLHTAQLPAIRPASYHASGQVASAATATDIATMPGNASNIVLLTRIQVTCTQTTAGNIVLSVLKRSTADTVGTSSAMTVVPDDSNYSAGASAPKVWTANPTKGTLVGTLDTYKLGCMATATATPNDLYVLNLRQKPIVLRGTAQEVEINLGAPVDGTGTTITGGSFDVTFEWMEVTTFTP